MYEQRNSPCKDCERRELHCHSNCDRYIAYQQSRRRVLNKQHGESIVNGYTVSVVVQNKERGGGHV